MQQQQIIFTASAWSDSLRTEFWNHYSKKKKKYRNPSIFLGISYTLIWKYAWHITSLSWVFPIYDIYIYLYIWTGIYGFSFQSNQLGHPFSNSWLEHNMIALTPLDRKNITADIHLCIHHEKTNITHYSDVTWESWCLKSLATQMFNNSFRLTTKKTWKFSNTGPLWGESTGHQWIPLTKGQ